MNTKELYIFDCLNADVCYRYFTKEQLPEKSEEAAVRLAADYEAYLYKYTIDVDTEETLSIKCLYEPNFC